MDNSLQYLLRRKVSSPREMNIAKRHHELQSSTMPVQFTIENVREEVHDILAAHDARQGQSMQEFLRVELERIASRPTANAWPHDVHE